MTRRQSAVRTVAAALFLLGLAVPAAASTGQVDSRTSTETATLVMDVAPATVTSSDRRLAQASRASRSVRRLAIPVRGRITSTFGDRSRVRSNRHTGLDIGAAYNTPVRAVVAGLVVKTAFDSAYGRTVVIRGDGVDIWYAHLARTSVKTGDRVRASQRIGRVGTTGNVTGAHLHLEVRKRDLPTDPAKFLWGPRRGTAAASPAWASTALTRLRSL